MTDKIISRILERLHEEESLGYTHGPISICPICNDACNNRFMCYYCWNNFGISIYELIMHLNTRDPNKIKQFLMLEKLSK